MYIPDTSTRPKQVKSKVATRNKLQHKKTYNVLSLPTHPLIVSEWSSIPDDGMSIPKQCHHLVQALFIG